MPPDRQEVLSAWAPGGAQRRALYLIDSLRAFGTGLLTIVFVVDARSHGMAAADIGVLSGASVVIGLAYTTLLSALSRRGGHGRGGPRTALVLSGCLMAATGVWLATVPSPTGIWLSAVFGFLPPSGGLFVAALVEGVLAHTPERHRSRTFGRSAALSTAAGAAGALTPLAAELAGLGPANLISTLLYTYAGAGLLMLLTSLLVRVDAGPGLDGPALVAGELAGSKPLVKRLALLFVLDSSGSGIAANTLVVYWLHADMGFSTGQLAVLMFAVDMLSAISAPLAVAVSKRAGLLRTAVFSHIPSSILLMAIPLAPGGAAAAALLLARALLVEMDVPTRQAYMSAVVAPEERQAAAAYVSRGKQLGRATGPLVGGFSFAEIGSGVFAVGGAVKIAYDLMLWRSFRTVKMQERVGAPDGMASSRGS